MTIKGLLVNDLEGGRCSLAASARDISKCVTITNSPGIDPEYIESEILAVSGPYMRDRGDLIATPFGAGHTLFIYTSRIRFDSPELLVRKSTTLQISHKLPAVNS